MELRGGEEKPCAQVPFEKVEPALRRPTLRWLDVGGVEPSNQSQIGNRKEAMKTILGNIGGQKSSL